MKRKNIPAIFAADYTNYHRLFRVNPCKSAAKKTTGNLYVLPQSCKKSFQLKFNGIVLISVFLSLLLFSCTKNIDVKIPDYRQQLVVEGSIEPGVKPAVYLTYSMPYFGDNSTSNLSSFAVKNALVTVNDGFITDTLKEVFAGQGFYYLAQTMTGVTGRTYNLTIQVNGNTYTSTTEIYPAVG